MGHSAELALRLASAARVAVTAVAPRFRFEELCASPPVLLDPRSWAVAERALVVNPEGQWQLQAQVLHWRGETWRGGQLAQEVFDTAAGALRSCQRTNVTASPSVTTDEPDRMAAVIGGPVILHQYLVANPGNSTITELAMVDGAPLTAWPGSMTPPCSTRWVHRCARRTSGRASRAGIAGSPVEFEPQVPPTSARSRVARVVVNVMPKAEILDPQGQAIVGALGRLGHAGGLRCPAGQAIRA